MFHSPSFLCSPARSPPLISGNRQFLAIFGATSLSSLLLLRLLFLVILTSSHARPPGNRSGQSKNQQQCPVRRTPTATNATSSCHQRNQQLPAALDSSCQQHWTAVPGEAHNTNSCQQLWTATRRGKSAAAGEKHICDQRVTSNSSSSRRPLAASSGGHFFWDFKGI
ncbi:hypothetical protein KY284_019395 [Solanum tuberosum]|nr:hypothetical protein KY284_019395 [Solanum tuberosum]